MEELNKIAVDLGNLFLDHYKGDDFKNIGNHALAWSREHVAISKDNVHWNVCFPMIVIALHCKRAGPGVHPSGFYMDYQEGYEMLPEVIEM